MIVQLAAAASGETHVLVCAKSPMVAMLVKLSGAVPVLVRVIGFAALVVLIVWLAKAVGTGRLTTGAAAVLPVPERVTL